MTALLPTRVSIYDFLFEDTQPIDAVVADFGHISLPQARIIIENGVQAITSALLAYNQYEGPDAVLKKLLCRSQIRELRKHNAFNSQTMRTAMQHGQSVAETLFVTTDIQKAVCQRLAQLSSLPNSKVRPLLSALTLLCLRELAILVDFAQLDANEVDQWLHQQSQFLRLSRDPQSRVNDSDSCYSSIYKAPEFDMHWHDLTRCKLPAVTVSSDAAQLPHYAKVIGRVSNTEPSDTSLADSDQLIVDKANNSDILTFCSIDEVTLPYQRWLLQLAKISDIYLSRNRLKIAPEPVQPPSRPLVSFGFMDNKPDSKAEPKAHSKSAPKTTHQPFWKNPVLILLVLVIGSLTLMAVGKYHYKKAQGIESPTQSTPIVANANQAKDNAH